MEKAIVVESCSTVREELIASPESVWVYMRRVATLGASEEWTSRRTAQPWSEHALFFDQLLMVKTGDSNSCIME